MADKLSLGELGVTSLRAVADMDNVSPPPMGDVADEFGVDRFSLDTVERSFQKIMSLDI